MTEHGFPAEFVRFMRAAGWIVTCAVAVVYMLLMAPDEPRPSGPEVVTIEPGAVPPSKDWWGPGSKP